MKKLFIISNESIFFNEGKYFCDNKDMKSTPEGLSTNFEINIFARKSKKMRSHEINIKNIRIFSSLFSFCLGIFNSLRHNGSKYLIISITPYTFLSIIFLKLFGKKPILYLRSDGYKEYKIILGFLGHFIYHLMFKITSSFSYLVSCEESILRKNKGELVKPSQLSDVWFSDIKPLNFSKIKLLFVGRIKKEKGVFSLLEMIKNYDFFLTIVGAEKNKAKSIFQRNVNVLEIESNEKNLIKYYDDHNIFILPSFTEGHPMALIESLARMRPVIIFDEVKHVAQDKKGVFISRRNEQSLLNTINHIKNNQETIQEEMKKNKLPTNKEFIKNLSNLISNLN